MPNGSLVTGFSKKILPNGQISPEIVFWERNGLRHGEFTLPHIEGEGKLIDVVDLKYNSDSSILALLIEKEGKRQILLYTRSNWRWYWKQVVDLKSIVSFHWSKKYQLVTVGSEGHLEITEFNPVYHSSGSNYNMGDDTTAYTSVIDGKRIHLTPLGK